MYVPIPHITWPLDSDRVCRHQIPKALVELNASTVLSVTTNGVRSGSKEEVRELGVSLQAFGDWLAVFRTYAS